MSHCTCLLLLAPGLAVVPASPPVEEISRFTCSGRLLLVSVEATERTVSGGDRLLVADTLQPAAWCEYVERRGDQLVFRTLSGALPGSSPTRWRAWLIRSSLVRMLLDRWPTEAELCARIESVGPGAHTAWLSGGRTLDLYPGQTWLRRLNGQPIARLEVRLVQDDFAFCNVIRLVADLRLSAGDTVTLWPSPGDQRRGGLRTAVVFVGPAGGAQEVWVAAPPGTSDPGDARLDVYRGRQYVGHAIVERWDERFWYARSLPAAGAGAIRVGDDACVRMPADKVAGPLVARVFEAGPEVLINAGELDGLSAGHKGVVHRGSQRLGVAEVQRTQPNYAVIRLAGGSPPFELQRLDEVRFGPEPPERRMAGRIVELCAATLFKAELADGGEVPALAPLSICTEQGATVGVALLVARDSSRACGFAVPESLVLPLATGQELWYVPETGRNHPAP
jgi:translation initiation factor IF-1